MFNPNSDVYTEKGGCNRFSGSYRRLLSCSSSFLFVCCVQTVWIFPCYYVCYVSTLKKKNAPKEHCKIGVSSCDNVTKALILAVEHSAGIPDSHCPLGLFKVCWQLYSFKQAVSQVCSQRTQHRLCQLDLKPGRHPQPVLILGT